MLSKNKNSLEILLDNRYIIKRNLGDGLTSDVFEAFDNITKKLIAVKIIKDEYFTYFSKEEKILTKINDLNLDSNIKFYCSGIGPLKENGKTEDKMYFILELASKNLLDVLTKKPNGFSEEVCKYIFYLLIKAVSALHEKGMCHRDLKPENILLMADNYTLKLTDFGFSTSFLDEFNKKKLLTGFRGTKRYIAPEIYENKPYEGDKVDIFSLGVSLFVLMTKFFPFPKAKNYKNFKKENQKLYTLIKDNKIDEYWAKIEKIYQSRVLSPEFKKLFIKMVSYNPSERPSCNEIMNSEWLKDIKNANNDYLELLKNKMINEISMEIT